MDAPIIRIPSSEDVPLTRRFDESPTKSLIYRGPVTKASDSSSDFVWEQPVGANSAAAAIGVTVIVFGLALAFNSMVIVPVSRVFRRIMKEPSSVTRSASAASLVSLRCDDFGKDTQPRTVHLDAGLSSQAPTKERVAPSLPDPSAVLGAATIGDVPGLVRSLSLKGALEETDADGATAAILASSNGHLPCVRALAEAGADFSAATTGGFTALHYAARGGHVDVVEFLLTLPRVDPNAREYTRNWAPIHFAMLKKHAQVVQVLRADKRVLMCGDSESFESAARRSDFRSVVVSE